MKAHLNKKGSKKGLASQPGKAMKVAHGKGVSAMKVVKKGSKKPGKAAVKKEVKQEVKKPVHSKAVKVEVSKKEIHKALPKIEKGGGNPMPVRYSGGVIYSSVKDKKFRALTTRGDNYSEKGASWKSAKPTMKAWRQSIDHIDTARKAGI